MKNFYSLLMVSLVSIGMFAQSYYVLPAINAGQNPGPQNTDAEFPLGGGLPAGWATVMAATTTDQWSSNQTIPFSFSFDGAAVTSYTVSNTGVLTFASIPGPAPSGSNTSLPSGLIPEKSILVWGLNISGVGSDNIVSKTFGTAPNRQHWVQFNSASGAGMPATAWTYWSIVLEETTNKIYVVDQRTANGTPALTVGIQVSTTNYTEVTGSPSVGTYTSNDPTAVDNSYYEFNMGTPPNGDVKAISEAVPGVVTPNTAVTIEGVFRNMGVTPISTADFNYTVNGGAKVTTALSSVSIASGEFKTISSPTQWTPTAGGVYSVEMWLSNINGSADPNPANDRITAKVVVTANPPERKVVIEERTGTWCQWCPRGAVAMEYMGLNNHDETVLIAVHNGDPMTVANYDPNLSGGFPTFTADRIMTAQSIGTGANMEGAMNLRRGIIPVASLKITNVTFTGGSSVKVDVESDFIVDETGADYRYQLIFVEDGVTGTSGGYNQSNAYAGGGSGPMIDAKGFNYATAPSSVPASQMVYHHVARSLEPSWAGAAGSVPSTLVFNQNVKYSFNTTLPSEVINPNHVRVAVLLLDNKKGGEVVNANEKKLTNVVGIEEVEALQANIFPNPASNFFNIELAENTDFSFELVNSIGQTVMVQNYTDAHTATVNTENLAKGVYFLNLKAGEQSSTMRIAITK